MAWESKGITERKQQKLTAVSMVYYPKTDTDKYTNKKCNS